MYFPLFAIYLLVLHLPALFADSCPQPALQDPAPQDPAPQGTALQDPASQSPAPQSPALQDPASQSPAPQDPASQSPAPQRPASQRPAPQRPAPQRPAPQRPAPQNSAQQSSPAPFTGGSFQATLTGYEGPCASTYGSCGIVANTEAYTGAVSAGWNAPSQPGQCGTCWRVTNGHSIGGNGAKTSPITTPPIVVFITNTCAPDLKKPGFQCNQRKGERDKFGSVTVLDLCHESGASNAFWGPGLKGNGGLATATITQVPCEQWSGQVNRVADWAKFKKSNSGKTVLLKKPFRASS
ncbi:hypothetical protein MMC22_005422 [Lobaria immixta]|nr:hypothetical protein [Lobaria immixta]